MLGVSGVPAGIISPDGIQMTGHPQGMMPPGVRPGFPPQSMPAGFTQGAVVSSTPGMVNQPRPG